MTGDAAVTGTTELLHTLGALPPLGWWITAAACAGLDEFVELEMASPVEELAVAGQVCAGCPALEACAGYAEQVPSWGVWGGRVWKARRSRSVLPLLREDAA